MPNYWLMKSEPGSFSFDDLARREKQTEGWDGVRNYQARNFMRDMTCGDLVLFYHSAIPKPGVVGIAEVVREAYPDPTQFDQQAKAYDPRATAEKPRWWQVDIQYKKALPTFVSLAQLREEPALEDIQLLKKGSRLSVMPVEPAHWAHILQLGGCNE